MLILIEGIVGGIGLGRFLGRGLVRGWAVGVRFVGGVGIVLLGIRLRMLVIYVVISTKLSIPPPSQSNSPQNPSTPHSHP